MSVVDDGLSLAVVYAAEDQVMATLDRGGTFDFYGSVLTLSPVRRWRPDQLLIMQGIVDGLYQKYRGAGVPELSPVLRVSEKAYARAWYSPNKHEIVLPRKRFAWNDFILCHELAHSLSRPVGSGNRAAHDLAWRRMYCALVRDVIGPEAELLLMNQFNL